MAKQSRKIYFLPALIDFFLFFSLPVHYGCAASVDPANEPQI
jgi:hypothetical protein